MRNIMCSKVAKMLDLVGWKQFQIACWWKNHHYLIYWTYTKLSKHPIWPIIIPPLLKLLIDNLLVKLFIPFHYFSGLLQLPINFKLCCSNYSSTSMSLVSAGRVTTRLRQWIFITVIQRFLLCWNNFYSEFYKDFCILWCSVLVSEI